MGKTTNCIHGVDVFEERCGQCDDEENMHLENEIDRLESALAESEKAREEAEIMAEGFAEVISAAHSYIRDALSLDVEDPERFDFYAEQINEREEYLFDTQHALKKAEARVAQLEEALREECKDHNIRPELRCDLEPCSLCKALTSSPSAAAEVLRAAKN